VAAFRVLVVDDSAFMRKVFSDIIDGDPDFSVIGTAVNGREALEKVAALKPDAVTMDLEMPVMNGYEALRSIMTSHPVPVIMLSGISEVGLRETIKALEFGAFDFIHKPDAGSIDIGLTAEQLLARLRAAVQSKRRFLPPDSPMPTSRIPPKTVPLLGGPERNRFPGTGPPKPEPRPAKEKGLREPVREPAGKRKPALSAPPGRKQQPERAAGMEAAAAGTPVHKPHPRRDYRDIVAIGTSTGGPRALHTVLTALPPDLRAPVLVVQHMPPKFTLSLAQRLDSFAALNVREASDGEPLLAGVVYIAPGGRHMTVARGRDGYRIRLSDEAARGGHRPSVDVLFESLLDCPDLRRHVVIMTGMGSDGAEGMKALAEQGISTAIAESEETCVVYGMPRSAVERGGAREVLPLQDIAPRLVDAVEK